MKGLIVIAEDGAAAATAVDAAAKAGVKVIAYDRLIKTTSISAYLSFDNVEVGKTRSPRRHDGAGTSRKHDMDER